MKCLKTCYSPQACATFGYCRERNWQTPQCRTARQGDEMTCSSCGLRWALDEPRPDCSRLTGCKD